METTNRRGRRKIARHHNRKSSSGTQTHRGSFGGGRSRQSGGSGGGNRNRSHSSSRSGRGSHARNRGSRSSGRNKTGRKMGTFDPSQFINKTPVETTSEIYTPKHTFNTFGLNSRIVSTITSLGMTTPTPIQDQIIPEILKGRDVIGIAETGTGKTAAFLIPLIEKTLKEQGRQTLILAPTRELALQIKDELTGLSRGLKIFSTLCVGGLNIGPQIKSLRHLNHFIIGTPGRVLDLIDRKRLLPGVMTTVVLDEADRMLDMGFINDMKTIISKTPDTRETLFFSATMSAGTKKLVHDFLRDPITVSVKKKDIAGSIEQDIVPYKHNSKFETLLDLLSKPEFKRVLVFGSMKHSVERLAKQLSSYKVKAESIHGNKNHGQRQRALTKFKNGTARVLVATDVAARGIHVENVTHVINYDLPNTFEDYVHRIGRTGRATKHGKALTFVQQRA